MITINKKFLQFVAAMLILISHLWIPVANSAVEDFIIRTGYIGVDVFFFVSAYSLADKDICYPELIKNRFFNIYLKFILLAIVWAVYKHVQIIKFIKTITMVDFLERGGGSFLWFLPAIFLFYISFPIFSKWNNKYKILIVLVMWFVLSYLMDTLLGYTKIFIFTNRIPVILAGYLLKKKKLPQSIMVMCFPIGVILIYLLGYRYRLNIPFREIYFALGIFFVIGLAAISGYIKERKAWNILGCCTLEVYGLQMIFGPKLATSIYRYTNNALATNILVILIIYVVSLIVFMAYKAVAKLKL